MNKILISIKPEWVSKILNEEKVVEIRKTAPKCDLPIEVYIYCTKAVPAAGWMFDDRIGKWVCLIAKNGEEKYLDGPILNGKVVAKFTLREVTEYINACNVTKDSGYMFGDTEREGIYEKACFSEEDIESYCPDESFYAWHISDLVIFNKPRELSELGVKRAPQSWQYLEGDEWKNTYSQHFAF